VEVFILVILVDDFADVVRLFAVLLILAEGQFELACAMVRE